MTVTMRWVFEGRVIEWEELGPSPNAPEPALFSRGLVGFDAATGQIVFQDFFGGQPHQFFGQREMMFKGTYTPLGGDRLQRTFTAFYGEGWNDRPPAGSQVQFRETWEPVGRDGWRWSSEILRDGTWGEYQPPVVMRRVPGEPDGR